jgi:hypothetical protein
VCWEDLALKGFWMPETIREGFDVFAHDGEKAFGAVRRVHKDGITIYVENGGDFEVPAAALVDAHSGKVIIDTAKLHPTLREAIRRAHTGEDPRVP